MLFLVFFTTAFSLDFSKPFFVHPIHEQLKALALIDNKVGLASNPQGGKVMFYVQNKTNLSGNLFIENTPICYFRGTKMLDLCTNGHDSVNLLRIKAKGNGYRIKAEDIGVLLDTMRCLTAENGVLKMTPCDNNKITQIFEFEEANRLSYCESNPAACIRGSNNSFYPSNTNNASTYGNTNNASSYGGSTYGNTGYNSSHSSTTSGYPYAQAPCTYPSYANNVYPTLPAAPVAYPTYNRTTYSTTPLGNSASCVARPIASRAAPVVYTLPPTYGQVTSPLAPGAPTLYGKGLPANNCNMPYYYPTVENLYGKKDNNSSCSMPNNRVYTPPTTYVPVSKVRQPASSTCSMPATNYSYANPSSTNSCSIGSSQSSCSAPTYTSVIPVDTTSNLVYEDLTPLDSSYVAPSQCSLSQIQNGTPTACSIASNKSCLFMNEGVKNCYSIE